MFRIRVRIRVRARGKAKQSKAYISSCSISLCEASDLLVMLLILDRKPQGQQHSGHIDPSKRRTSAIGQGIPSTSFSRPAQCRFPIPDKCAYSLMSVLFYMRG